MNVFKRAINHIYKDKNLTQQCLINGKCYTVIQSKISEDITYGVGSVDEENFTLDVELPIFPMVKENDKVIFDDKLYKISHFQIDSSKTTVKLYIITCSKGK